MGIKGTNATPMGKERLHDDTQTRKVRVDNKVLCRMEKKISSVLFCFLNFNTWKSAKCLLLPNISLFKQKRVNTGNLVILVPAKAKHSDNRKALRSLHNQGGRKWNRVKMLSHVLRGKLTADSIPHLLGEDTLRWPH